MARRKRGGAHGGHGWFVTFADLMALLMSFFVMVAAYSTQDQKKLQLVAGSMRDAFGVSKDSKFAGITEWTASPAADRLKNLRDIPPERATDRTTPPAIDKGADDGMRDKGQAENFGLAAASLRQALQDMPDFAEISKNVMIARNEKGLDVSIVDQDGRSMFPEGSSRPNDRTRRLIEKLAPALRQMPNRIVVTGYTATDRPGRRPSRPRGNCPPAGRSASGRSWPAPACPTTASARWPARPTPSRCSRTTLHAGQPPGDGDAPEGGAPDPDDKGHSVIRLSAR